MDSANQQSIGPDFCCIGAQKAGTGWLYEQVRFHPDFWMPPLKELHYFDRRWRSEQALAKMKARIPAARSSARDERDLRFLDLMENLAGRPEIDLEKYAELFAGPEGPRSGDITPGYSTLEEDLIAQITRRFPAMKVIFFARDPVERAWSHLSMWVRHGVIPRFAVEDLDQVTEHLRRPEVMLRSFPTRIVARWRRFVAPELFRVYFFDDLKTDAGEFRRTIMAFLGGDPGKASGQLRVDHNPKAKLEKLALTGKVRSHLAHFFEEELKACAEKLGGPACAWPARYGF